MTSHEILFENNRSTFLAGQMLHGTVKLILIKPISVRSIYIRIYGRAYACWKQPIFGKNLPFESWTTRTIKGEEYCLDEKTYLLDGGGKLKIDSGVYEYPFEFMLPPNLPSSVEGEIGYIRYTASVVFDVPFWINNLFDEPFTVTKEVDLNDVPLFREPVNVEENKTFYLCCLFCFFTSNPLKITARTTCSGYFPGQTIKLEIDVDNQSGLPVSEFSVQLIKQIIFPYVNPKKGKLCKKIKTIPFDKEITRGCDAGAEQFLRMEIEVPSIPPTDFTVSTIVQFRYLIRIIGSVSCFHKNPVLDLPITIGSNPIQHEIRSPDELSCNIEDPPTNDDTVRLI